MENRGCDCEYLRPNACGEADNAEGGSRLKVFPIGLGAVLFSFISATTSDLGCAYIETIYQYI